MKYPATTTPADIETSDKSAKLAAPMGVEKKKKKDIRRSDTIIMKYDVYTLYEGMNEEQIISKKHPEPKAKTKTKGWCVHNYTCSNASNGAT